MTFLELKTYVEKNKDKVPQEERDLFDFNFACVFTKNSVGMEHKLWDVSLEEVVSIVKGFNVRIDGNVRRNIFNHYQAFQIVKDQVASSKPLTEDFIKDLHEVLMKGIMPGGLYRNVDISIRGSNHTPPSYIKVYDRMNRYFYDLEHFEGSDIELVAFAHLQFVKIHPFLDGNGRLARLIINYYLLKLGYLPISIPFKRRLEYFDTLEEYKVNKNPLPFQELITDLLNKEYRRLFQLIKKFEKDN